MALRFKQCRLGSFFHGFEASHDLRTLVKCILELTEGAFFANFTASLRRVVLQGKCPLWQPVDSAFSVNIILHYAVLVFDQISVELMVMETTIVFQIIRVTLDIYIFDQLREFAFVRSFRYLSVIILSFSIVVIKHTRLPRHSIVTRAVGSLR